MLSNINDVLDIVHLSIGGLLGDAGRSAFVLLPHTAVQKKKKKKKEKKSGRDVNLFKIHPINLDRPIYKMAILANFQYDAQSLESQIFFVYKTLLIR